MKFEGPVEPEQTPPIEQTPPEVEKRAEKDAADLSMGEPPIEIEQTPAKAEQAAASLTPEKPSEPKPEKPYSLGEIPSDEAEPRLQEPEKKLGETEEKPEAEKPIEQARPVTEQPPAQPEKSAEATKPEGAAEKRDKITKTFHERFNLKPEELQSIEGFSELSDGRKLLVAENLSQITLGRIQEDALKQYKENTTQSKFLGRVWQGVTKSYQIAKLEKVSAEQIQKGGMKSHGEVLKLLVDGAKEGPEATATKEGTLEIQFAAAADIEKITGEKLNKKELEKIADLNIRLGKMGEIPAEWAYKSATKDQRRQYKERMTVYNFAREGLLKFVSSKLKTPDKSKALLYVQNIDRQLQLQQLLNTHPEAEEQLQKIDSKPAWTKIISDTVTERGIYAASGFLARSAMISALGLMAAPVAAGAIGGISAYRRGKETLRQEEKLSRRGEIKTEKRTLKSGDKIVREKKDFADVENLNSRIKELMAKLNDPDNEKRGLVLQHLDRLLKYSNEKLASGLINFGGDDARLVNQYEFIHNLGVSQTFLTKENYPKKVLDERLEKALNLRQEKISAERKKYLKNQVVDGIVISATFAYAGALTRHVAGQLFWGEEMPLIKIPINKNLDLVFGGSPKEIGSAEFSEEAKRTFNELSEQLGRHPTVDEMTEALSKGATPEDLSRIAVEAEYGTAAAEKAAETAEIQPGDSVWKIIENQSEEEYGDKFTNLDQARQTYIIDYAKDAIAADPEKYGFPSDINNLEAGQEYNAGAVKELLRQKGEAMFNKADKLTDYQIRDIERNNEIISEWHKAYPNEQLTEEKVDSILKTVLTPTESTTEGAAGVENIAPEQAVSEMPTAGEHGTAPPEEEMPPPSEEALAAKEKPEWGVSPIETAPPEATVEQEILRKLSEKPMEAMIPQDLEIKEMEFAGWFDFKPEEYEQIRELNVGELLEKIPAGKSMRELTDLWSKGEINLPHKGAYGFWEFKKHVRLTEYIRAFNPDAPNHEYVKHMSVGGFLRFLGSTKLAR